jgi:chaperonin GroES
MAINYEPLADRVIVKPIAKEEVTKGGIVLPDTAKERPQEGEVIAVGPGRLSEDGKRIPVDVQKGDRVIYAKYGGTELKYEDVEYLVLRESDILAKVGKPKAGKAKASKK